MTDSEKLKNFRIQRKLSQQEIADELGVKQTLVSMIERGTRLVSPSFKLAFLKVYGIDWDTQIASGETFNYENLESPTENIISIPYYPDVKAAAGLGEELADIEDKEYLYFDKRWLSAVIGRQPKNLSLIRAEGNSMSPSINDGDLLMIDTSIKEIIPNKIFVIKQDNLLRVKRLKTEFNGDVLIISDNTEYPIETLNKTTNIVGQVVWNGSKENV